MSSKNSAKLTGAAAASAEKRHAKERAERKALWGKRIKNVVIFLAVAFLAAVAGVVSYSHIQDLVILAGQDASQWYSPANMLPLTPDVLLVVAAFKGRKAGASRLERLVAKVSMLTGLLMSLAGNVTMEFLQPSSPYTALSMVVAGSPVLLLLLAVEMLTHVHKDAKVTQRKPDGIIALTRAIVRQVFLNKLANMKGRKGSAPVATAKPQVSASVTLPVVAEFPTFPQLDPMIKATADNMARQRKLLVPAQRVIH